jgi:biopolymer transport protein ExbD
MPFKQSRNRVIIPVVEMTPMIDIVFLLIIFFMVAAQFAHQARVEVNLPKEKGEGLASREVIKLIVNIRENGDIILDETAGVITLSQLKIELETMKEDRLSWEEIIIRADANASSRKLNQVLETLRKNGLNATNIATEVTK